MKIDKESRTHILNVWVIPASQTSSIIFLCTYIISAQPPSPLLPTNYTPPRFAKTITLPQVTWAWENYPLGKSQHEISGHLPVTKTISKNGAISWRLEGVVIAGTLLFTGLIKLVVKLIGFFPLLSFVLDRYFWWRWWLRKKMFGKILNVWDVCTSQGLYFLLY